MSTYPSSSAYGQQLNHENQHTQQNPYPSSSPAPANQGGGGRFTEDWDAKSRGTSIIEGKDGGTMAHSVSGGGGGGSTMERTQSIRSFAAGDDQHMLPQRRNTLKKKNSLRRTGSLKRSGSRRSMRAGSVKSLVLDPSTDPDEMHSALYCPVPTTGHPTEILANRFQSWRKILKDLITYFREVQSHYEHRSKALLKLANASTSITAPPGFLTSAGIDDALQFLRTYHKNAIVEANKAKEIEEDVIIALTGLRSDLHQKIKEIKHLSGDFKNSVEKEMDVTRKAVRMLQEALGRNEVDDASTIGKQDPYLLRLHVDRQVERQLDEENYLHQAYLNLENSGRELESIVVGEIQKAYNAYAGILKREADNAYGIVEELRDGPISMSKDHEWMHFLSHEEQFLDPTIPLRTSQQIHYPGQNHVSAQEIRAGLLERKSKYLRSYTAGWYVLSTTHLHEFKSADKGQAPIVSLYLPEQKLGSHSVEGSTSNKFILKGRQTGSMHRGHTWVFRAESFDTMMAWYEDIKALTEKTPEERSHFVRSHSRSMSQSSRRSLSSDGLGDEDDEEPFSAGAQIDVNPGPRSDTTSRRPEPGGRFPSDLQLNTQRGLQAPPSHSSLSSSVQEHRQQEQPQQDQHQQNTHQQGLYQQEQGVDAGAIAAAMALPGAAHNSAALTEEQGHERERQHGYGNTEQAPIQDVHSHAAMANQEAYHDGVNPYTSEPTQASQPSNMDDSEVYIAPVVAGGLQQMRPIDDNEEYRQQQPSHLHPQRIAHPYSYSTAGSDEYTTTQPQQGAAMGGAFASGPSTAGIAEKHWVGSVLSEQPLEDRVPLRPSMANTRNGSLSTIANLHVPGSYPRGGNAN